MKKTYLLVLGVICLFSFALYSTYAMFTQDVNIGQFVNLTASNLSATESSIQKYERLTLESGDSKKIDLNITNSTSSSLYYGVWYEMIEPSTINNNITIAKLDESPNPIIGQLTASQTKTVTLYLENSTNDDVIVNIGVGYSDTNSLNLPTGRTIITAEASEAIDASNFPLPFVKDYNYNYDVRTLNITSTGSYKLEVWGAQGGSYNSSYAAGGKGGYSYGTVTLNQGDVLYIHTGEKGSYSTQQGYTVTDSGGNNGGGAVGYRGGAGGSASDIRIGTDNYNYRVIVAGGGGGAYAYSSTYKAEGGYGGGTTGGAGSYYSSSYTAFTGKGGTQTTGGAGGTGSSANYNGKAGGFGTGGSTGYKYNNTSYYSNGAGGSGWYGGGGAGNYSSNARTRGAGGGGGSGFVWTSATASSAPSSYALSTKYYMSDAATIAGNTSFPSPTGESETGHSYSGYARVTFLVDYPTLTGLTQKTILLGTTVDLTSGVTCVDNGTGCTLVKVSITDTSTLAAGTYSVKYIVKDNNDVKYQYVRTLIVADQNDAITNLYKNAAKSTFTTASGETIALASSVNLMQDSYGNIRYYGANANNYVTFNNELWRIIGVFYVDGEYRIKLIRNSSLPGIAFDNKPAGLGSNTSNLNYGSNDWYDARLMMTLNPPEYTVSTISSYGSTYWNQQSGTCYSGYNNATKSCDFSSSSSTPGLSSTARNMIAQTTYYLGGSTGMSEGNGDYYPSEAYDLERSDNVYPGHHTSWSGYVALPYLSDVLYSADLQQCNIKWGSWGPTSWNTCEPQSWLTNIIYSYSFTLFQSINDIYIVYVPGNDYSVTSHVYYADGYGAMTIPVLYLKPSVIVNTTGLDGSSSHPYTLTLN